LSASRDDDVKQWLSRLKVVEAQHHIFAYGPTHALASYLEERVANFLYILHPFREHRHRSSEAAFYRKGRLLYRTRFGQLIAPDIVLYIKDLLVTFLATARSGLKFDLFMGADCLNAFAGLILKKFLFVRKVVLFEIDFSPRRFENTLLNLLYHFLDLFCSKKVDIIWSQTNRIAKAKITQGIPATEIIVVPQGALPYGMRLLHAKTRNRNRIVFLGNLTREKGFELLIETMDELRNTMPLIEVIVIGTGPHQASLRDEVKRRGIANHFRFLGYVKDNSEIIQIISSCGIGVAPYVPGENEFSTYGDPGKVKLYLACGLPVILTRVPEFADVVEKFGAGIVIDYSKDSLKQALLRFITDHEFYLTCSANALDLASRYDYSCIFHDSLTKTKSLLSE